MKEREEPGGDPRFERAVWTDLARRWRVLLLLVVVEKDGRLEEVVEVVEDGEREWS